MNKKILFITGLSEIELENKLAKLGANQTCESPRCWICRRDKDEVFGSILHENKQGKVIPQTLHVDYFDFPIDENQVIKIPICIYCIGLIQEAMKKDVKLVPDPT